MKKVNLNNITIVLHKPRFPENIGSAARAAANMGISELFVVCPENFDREKILQLATHAAAHVVNEIKIFDDLLSALETFNYVAGTTARTGKNRPYTLHPRRMAEKIRPLSHHSKAALLFGPEDRGLTNEELKLCQDVVLIPTSGFHSLNVAQAVMIMCWELFNSSGEMNDDKTAPASPATIADLEGMYDHLQETLLKIDFIDSENPLHWMRNIRRFFNRFMLRKSDVNFIRGICRQIDWYIREKTR